MELTLNEIANALGASVQSDKTINRISLDSRNIDENTLFFAIKGERFDAHDFAKQVAENGAAALVCHKKVDVSCPVIYVDDTKNALLKLSSYYRSKFKDLILIGLTGSVGKTTTKEMTACVMEQKYKTLKTEGNFNNEIGMPKTLFRIEKDTECAVIEMGMSEFGEISALSNAALPNCAIISNIGVSHIENLGSRDGIFKAKLEMLEGLKKGSPLVLNGDDDKLSTVKNSDFKVLFFGINNPKCDVRAVDIKEEELHTGFTVLCKECTQKITLPTVGIHNVYNALAAITVGLCFGVTLEQAANGLKDYVPSGMRQRIKKVGNITFIEDCYNASPDSQKAALNSLCTVANGRKIAVVGDMLELGSYSETAHRLVGEYAAEKKIDFLYTFGENSKYTADSARLGGLKNVFEFTDKIALADALIQELKDGDTVIFKASRGMKLEEVFNIIYEKRTINKGVVK